MSLRLPAALAGAATAALLPALLPPAARAQGPVLLETFGAREQARSAPVFGGLGLATYRGPFGVRISGALSTAHDQSSTTYYQNVGGPGCRRGGCESGYYDPSRGGLRVAAWSSDADLVLEPFRATAIPRALLLGFSPYGFAGVGYYDVRPSGVADTGRTSFTYGAGVRHQLLGGLGLTAEARWRRALNTDSATSTALRQNTQWRSAQYRVGLTFSFGGRHAVHYAGAPIIAPVAAAPNVVPNGMPAAPPSAAVSAGARIVARVLDVADGLVGTAYRAGGSSPVDGFDAPGFVRYVFAREGVDVSGDVGRLAAAGTAVTPAVSALRPGDLLFFANEGTTPDHVAVYAGRGRFVHATASGGGVRYDLLGDGARGQWFASHLLAARRIVDAVDRPRDGDAAPPPSGAGAADAGVQLASHPDEAPTSRAAAAQP